MSVYEQNCSWNIFFFGKKDEKVCNNISTQPMVTISNRQILHTMPSDTELQPCAGNNIQHRAADLYDFGKHKVLRNSIYSQFINFIYFFFFAFTFVRCQRFMI